MSRARKLRLHHRLSLETRLRRRTSLLPRLNTTLPPAALQAQLSSLMAQFLQYATPPASTSHEATRSTGNLSPASTEHHLEQPPLSTTAATNFSTVAVPPGPTTVTATTSQPAFTYQASSLPAAVTFNVQTPPLMAHGAPTAVAPKLFGYSTAADTCSIAPSYACHWLDHAATTLPPIDNTAYSPPNGHRHLTTSTCSNTPKDYTR